MQLAHTLAVQCAKRAEEDKVPLVPVLIYVQRLSRMLHTQPASLAINGSVLMQYFVRELSAHPKRVESCVPRERLLSIRLAADAGEVAKLAPFVGCPNSSAAIADAWAALHP